MISIGDDTGHKSTVVVKATICGYYMKVRIEIEKISKGLNGNNRCRLGIIKGNTLLKILG